MADCLSPSSSSKSLVRSPSSPSLAHAVGLPLPIPDSGILPPSSPPKSLSYRYPSGSHTLPRLGEVESLASSLSSNPTRDDNMPDSTPTTPRRKIVNSIDVPTPRSAKKRSTLQERLGAAAAGPTKIPRISALPPVPPMPVNSSTPLPIPSTPGPSREMSKSSDKVIVCMRIKPTGTRFSRRAYEVTPQSLTLSDTHPSVVRRGGKAGREAEYTYNFDTLVQYPTTTPELYANQIAPLVNKAMNGFNSTVFAYGQTGSGKSHTMSGTRHELGIIPCAVDGIFDAITADPDRAFLLRVSYLEIYNEAIRDLLNYKKADDAKVPTIKSNKGKVFVDPLVEEIVSNPADVVEILSKGNSNRKTGATDWNERSSRSHAVFTIIIESRPRDNDERDEVRVSRLTLIDLAGSEKAVSDMERRGEGRHINQSLLALREVVHKLTETGKKGGHIPYRNSKLTHLLESVLGGDSNICVICTMSAEEEHCPETLETLKFASRCSQVETKAQKNVLHGSDLAVIRAKDREIAELKRQLESMASAPRALTDALPTEHMTGLADEVATMEARKVKLAEQLAKLNGEILTSELPRSGVGLPVEQVRKRRPRISDFSSLSAVSQSTGLGLGIPGGTPKKMIDRRAVSTMVRVHESFYADDDADASFVEDAIEKLDPGKPFDHDITIASLRRTIASRDGDIAQQAEKLNAALAEAGELNMIKEKLAAAKAQLDETTTQYTKKLSDTEESFKATQETLEKVVTEKGARVEELEASLTELRESYKKSSKKSQDQLAELQADLDTAITDRDGRLKEIEALKATHIAQIAQIKEVIKILRAQADQNAAQVAELEGVRDELKKTLASVEAEREAARSEHATAAREAEQAKTDLEAFQQSSKGRESEAMASFKTELDKERDLRSKAESALEEATKDAAAHASSSAEEKDRLEKSLAEANDKVSAVAKDKADAERRIAEAGTAHETSKREAEAAATAAKAQLDELNAKIAALTAESDGHKTTGEELIAQLGQIKTQLEEKSSSHDRVTRQLAEVKDGLEKKSASNDEACSALEALKVELEEKVKSLEAAVRERDDIKVLLDTATASHTQFAKNIKTELDDKITTLADAEKERDGLKAALHTKSAAHDETLAAFDQLKAELEAKTKSLDEAIKERDDIKTALEKATSQNDKRTAELKTLQEQLAERVKAHAEVAGQLETTKIELASKVTALDEATAKATELSEKLKEKLQAHAEAEGALDAAKSELEAKTASLTMATSEIDSLRAGANVAVSIRGELEDHRRMLDEEKAERTKLAELHTAAASRSDALAAEVAEGKAALSNEKEAHAATASKLSGTDARIAALETELAASRKERDELSTELAASKKERDELSTGLATSNIAKTDLQSKLDSTLQDLSGINTQLASAEGTNRSALDAHRAELEQLRSEVEVAKGAAAAAELRLASASADSTLKYSGLADELAKANSELEDYKKAQADLKDSLKAVEKEQAKAMETMRAELASVMDARKAADKAASEAGTARKESERRLVDANSEVTKIKERLDNVSKALEAERGNKSKGLESAVTANSSLQKELTLSKSEYAALRARCDRLAAELVDAQSNKDHKRPATYRPGLTSSASVPSFLSSVGAQALRGQGGMSSSLVSEVEGWRRSHASEEIGQLDKVVEAQKAVIEEQRSKISVWADELDKQRAAVRLLTADIESCTCGANGSHHANGSPDTPKRRHMRASLSMSSVPSPTHSYQANLENLSPAPSGYSSARTRGHISSTFTARNLALPSAPSPLPMHTGQFSNTRKHRRVTLEHDINRLQEGGRVSTIKNVFDSDSMSPPATPVRGPSRVGSRHTDVRRRL